MPEVVADGFTGNRVRVAVIDSGVQVGHPHILAARILPGTAILPDGTMLTGDGAAIDRLGHGTAVAAAIQEKAPDADIVPIRVFHDALKASARALTAGIERSLELGVDIINLSLGTTNAAHRDLFAGLVARATAQGVLIVAARDADGVLCWPGGLDGVLGVGLDWEVPRDRWRVAGNVVYASGHPRPIPGVPQQRNFYGISFATAQVSGFAARACARLRGTGRDTTALYAAMLEPDAVEIV